MDQILEMISKWDRLGQGVFFLIVIGSILSTICFLFKCFVALFRGWPPPDTKIDEED